MDRRISVLLADDHAMVRDAIAWWIRTQDDITVVAGVANADEAVEQATALRPDVVLMDIQMPGMNGLEATRQIVALGREETSRVLVLTTFELDEYVYEALRAGASGFLLKRTPSADLIAGIWTIAGGDALLAPSVTRRLIHQFAQRPAARPADTRALEGITDREREVLALVARGLSNAEIAEVLVLSEGTVKTHTKHLFAKLDVRDRTQAVILAYDIGLVEPRSG